MIRNQLFYVFKLDQILAYTYHARSNDFPHNGTNTRLFGHLKCLIRFLKLDYLIDLEIIDQTYGLTSS